jgi:hypothetical protein
VARGVNGVDFTLLPVPRECGPSLAVNTGMEEPFRTTFTERDYARVRQLGDE